MRAKAEKFHIDIAVIELRLLKSAMTGSEADAMDHVNDVLHDVSLDLLELRGRVNAICAVIRQTAERMKMRGDSSEGLYNRGVDDLTKLLIQKFEVPPDGKRV